MGRRGGIYSEIARTQVAGEYSSSLPSYLSFSTTHT
jgi:hypothetical protein